MMSEGSYIGEFRQLYNDVFYSAEAPLYATVLAPREAEIAALMKSLAKYKRRNSPCHRYEVHSEELWSLYALSRVNDALLFSFQLSAPQDDSFVAKSQGYVQSHSKELVTPQQYLQFFEAIGFEHRALSEFHPFTCEIVEVVPDENVMQPVVEHEFWPALMWGNMLWSRAGVRVRARSCDIDKTTAELSTLHWSRYRLFRRTDDLSIGWGSNSQWSTRFRRDYDENGCYFYNVDGRSFENVHWLWNFDETDFTGDKYFVYAFPDEPRETWRTKERRELLTYRCWVRRVVDDEMHIYSDAYITRKP